MKTEKGSVIFARRWGGRFNFVAYGACSLMLCLSVIDILGAKLFAWPLPGAADVVGLLAVLVAAFPIASTELSGGHVRLDLGLVYLPKRMKAFFQGVGNALSVALFVLMIIAFTKYGINMQKTGEASMTVAVPFYPFVYAIVISCLLALFVLILELVRSVNTEKGGNEE